MGASCEWSQIGEPPAARALQFALSGVLVIPAVLIWAIATSIALGRVDRRARSLP
jgi:hypothetical protein